MAKKSESQKSNAKSKNDLSEAMAAAVARAGDHVLGVSTGCGRGSGFALDEQTVVTSAALIGDAEQVSIWKGEERHPGKVLGRDAATDVALVQSQGKLGTPLPFVDAGEVRVGHLALALGRPGRSVRASLRLVGVVADDVKLPGGGRLERYVETDRALPHGFGGGPLIDLEGNVIGMNSRAVLRRADLAITAATIQRIARAIRDHGNVVRGYLGVGVYPARLPAKLREELGRERGAVVVAIDEGSAAESASLAVGDILVELSGDPISGPRTLRDALYERADTEVDLAYVRGGAIAHLQVKVGKK